MLAVLAAPDQLSLMRSLKLSTTNEHHELETALDLLDSSLDLASYKRLLERFLGFYDPWEASCASALGNAHTEWFSARRKSHLLRRDLEVLGKNEHSFACLPQCTELPSLRTTSSALGSMYVIEGSTLGGQLLARHFHSRLGVDANSGAAFFNGYGERTAEMWRNFAHAVERHVPRPSADEAICAARATFRSLHRWLAPARGMNDGIN